MKAKQLMKFSVHKVLLENDISIDLKQTAPGEWVGFGFILRINYYEKPGQTIFKPVLYATENTPEVVSLKFCFPNLDEDCFRVLRFGFNMPGDPVGFYNINKNGFSPPLKKAEKKISFENDEKCMISSNSLLCFKAENSDKTTLIGAESFDKTEGTIEFICNKAEEQTQIDYKMILDGIKLSPNQELQLDSFVVMTGNDLNLLLKQWAELTAEANGSLMPKKIPTGWNDWQYYRNEKTAKDVLDSAVVIADMKSKGYPLDFVQVDGGFCVHLSEWSKPKPQFEPGIKELAEKIVNMGLKFGLWFAPYIQNVQTSVIKEHPEWALKDKKGEVVILGQSNVGESCLIDYTVPGTEEWLRQQLRLFVDDWQVKWIKLDGPNYALYRQGQLHDNSKTISQMLNRTFEIIREEAGADVLVEGEGMMGLALGKVKLHRVQTDNHPKWYESNSSDQEYAPRVYGKELIMGFLHNRWWCNHRENVILRNYPSEFCHAGINNPNAVEQMFTEPEFRTQLTAAVMGSGGLLLTDPMKELIRDKERFAWISKLLPVYNKAAEMVDTFPAGRYPSVYKIDVNDDLRVYSFTNWTDKIRDFECMLPVNIEFHAFSVFDRKVLGVVNNTLKINGVTAHDSRIIVLKRRKNTPQLAATDLHLLPGAMDIKKCQWKDDTLVVEVCHFKQDDNHLFLAANGHEIVNITTNAKRFSVDAYNFEYPVIRFEGNSEENTVFNLKWRNHCDY